MKYAYFAGGCFWCITPVFDEMPGVRSVTAGYSGGCERNPSYSDVKHQLTGHRETIRIEYDETAVSYDTLLDTFLGAIDPQDAGGQFIDRGHSYTAAVYYTCDAERLAAENKLRALGANAVASEPFRSFFDAEEEHQSYYKKHPEEFAKEMISSGRVKQSEE